MNVFTNVHTEHVQPTHSSCSHSAFAYGHVSVNTELEMMWRRGGVSAAGEERMMKVEGKRDNAINLHTAKTLQLSSREPCMRWNLGRSPHGVSIQIASDWNLVSPQSSIDGAGSVLGKGNVLTQPSQPTYSAY